MTEKKRLVSMIFRKLDIIETQENQPTVNLIRGLLRELSNID